LGSASGCAGGGAGALSPKAQGSRDTQQAKPMPVVSNQRAPRYLHGETVEHYFDRVARKIEDKDVDANIDASIVGHDRDVIRSYMLSLPKWAREHVTYVDKDGRVYANRQSSVSALHIGHLVAGTTNTYVDQNGAPYSVPPLTEKPESAARAPHGSRAPLYGTPPATTSTGPYRRAYSDPSIWYAGGLHTIVPVGATSSSSEGPNGDTGYVYSGGWSSSGSDQVDAGIQYSASRGVLNLYYRDAFNYNGNRGGYAVTDLSVDYAPAVDLEVDFIIGNSGCTQSCVGDPNNLTTFVWGDYAYNQGYGGTTLGFAPQSLSDWKSSSTVLKAMVSIAQNSNSQPDGVFHDGYSFGVIAIDYCGWSGQGFNYCYQPGYQSAYHFQSVPASMVSSLYYQYYDEGVDIQIPT
jgi:hypothetical protein